MWSPDLTPVRSRDSETSGVGGYRKVKRDSWREGSGEISLRLDFVYPTTPGPSCLWGLRIEDPRSRIPLRPPCVSSPRSRVPYPHEGPDSKGEKIYTEKGLISREEGREVLGRKTGSVYVETEESPLG